jgi:methyltransferase OMS1, mitochondrial
MRVQRGSVVPHMALSTQSRQKATIDPIYSFNLLRTDPRKTPANRAFQRAASTSTSRLPPAQPNLRRLPTSTRGGANASSDVDLVAGRAGRKIGIYIWGSCIFGFTLALYISSAYASHSRAVKATSRLDLPQNADVSNRWRDPTRNFDEEVNLSEKWLLLRAKRKRLVNEAYGSVLEVSCGTGRNMDLYDLRPYDPSEDSRTGRSRKRIITSLTFNDQSEVMIDHAKDKFADMEAHRNKRDRFTGPVRFIVGDAAIKGTIDRPAGGYDTIVQTMGVCSTSHASALLRRLGQLCRQPGEFGANVVPENDDGRGGKILLLEHGKGHFDFINRFLDDGAKMHAAHYGCWWNKDIDEVVKESGLVVERMTRYNFGTTWEIVLRPAPVSGQITTKS